MIRRLLIPEVLIPLCTILAGIAVTWALDHYYPLTVAVTP